MTQFAENVMIILGLTGIALTIAICWIVFGWEILRIFANAIKKLTK